MNQYWTIYILKRFIPGDKILTLYFKNKIDCCSIMDTVRLRVPTEQISDLSTYNVSNVSTLSPSTRCVTPATNICKRLDIFNKRNICLQDTFSFA
jgi:hypothetical protein